jgi:NADH-quinone oxidoreductase subunit N
MALLVRVALGVSVAPPTQEVAHEQIFPAQTVAFLQQDGEPASAGGETVSATTSSPAQDTTPTPTPPLAPVRTFIVYLLAIIAAVTCTFGNLAAYGQTNIKRLLAYSTIAHAGYMMMAVAAAVQLAGTNEVSAREAVSALVFYLAMYVFMNLGAFAIVAFLRGAIGSEEIADYAGLIRSVPVVAVAFVTILVSLVGIPPLAGFIGKFAVFAALVDAGGPIMISLLVIAGLNTVISLIYYLRVAKVVSIDPEPETRGPITLGILPTAYVLIVAIPVLYYGLRPAWILEIAHQATQQLFL